MQSQVEFIQFLPHNVRKRVIVERSMDVALKALEIKKRGFRLECKVADADEVTVAVADAGLDFLLASRTVKNGPELLEAVDGLISDVHGVMMQRDEAHRLAAAKSGTIGASKPN